MASAIDTGMATIGALAEGRWPEVEDRREGILRRLEALRAALGEDTATRRRLSRRVGALCDIVRGASVEGDVPNELVGAARACRGPVPVPGRGTPEPPLVRRPAPADGHLSPARAMAVGGARTEFGGPPPAPFPALQRLMDGLVPPAEMSFVVDRCGQLLAASGDADPADMTALADWVSRSVAENVVARLICGEGNPSEHYYLGARRGLVVRLLERRVLVTAVFAVEREEAVRRRMAQIVVEGATIVDRMVSRLPEITAEDLRKLFEG